MAKTPRVIRKGDLKPRNKTVQQAIVRRWGSGAHKGSKADQSKKACRGKPQMKNMAECLAAVNLMMLEVFGKKPKGEDRPIFPRRSKEIRATVLAPMPTDISSVLQDPKPESTPAGAVWHKTTGKFKVIRGKKVS